jgi:hypothetical protein
MGETLAGAELLMQQALGAAGFDSEAADLGVAWETFRKFAEMPLRPLQTATVGYECFHVDDRDDVLWVMFVRQVEDDAEIGWQIGCVFSRPVPAELWGIAESNWWWREHGGFAEWVAEVEGMKGFRACMAMGGWRWEGTRA